MGLELGLMLKMKVQKLCNRSIFCSFPFKIKYFGSIIKSLKTKTLIVKDLEGLRVVPPVL